MEANVGNERPQATDGVAQDGTDAGKFGGEELNFEFSYPHIIDAPEHHRTIAIQRAMGMGTMDIAGATGFAIGYVERVLNHQPVIDSIDSFREALNDRVVQSLNEWTGLLDKAVGALKDSLSSENERVRLTAATEYLDRHPSAMFIKRKQVDAAGAQKPLDTSAIEELKRNAVKTKGANHDRGAITGPTEQPASGGRDGPSGIVPVGGNAEVAGNESGGSSDDRAAGRSMGGGGGQRDDRGSSGGSGRTNAHSDGKLAGGTNSVWTGYRDSAGCDGATETSEGPSQDDGRPAGNEDADTGRDGPEVGRGDRKQDTEGESSASEALDAYDPI